MLYVSRAAAVSAAVGKIALGIADRYHVQVRLIRQADKSLEQGFRAILFKRGRVVGFA